MHGAGVLTERATHLSEAMRTKRTEKAHKKAESEANCWSEAQAVCRNVDQLPVHCAPAASSKRKRKQQR